MSDNFEVTRWTDVKCRVRTRAVAALALFACSVPVHLYATCTTQFNNQSDFTWSISGYDTNKAAIIVPPHTVGAIPWGSAAEIVVSGVIPDRQYTRVFQVTAANGCFTIEHQGNVGLVTLNSPNNGDVVTCAGGC